MRTLLLFSLLVTGSGAQTATDPSPIFQIVRKPGVRAVAASPAYGDANAAVNVVGLVGITGIPETWWIEAHPAFASVEALDQALSALHSGAEPSTESLLAPTETLVTMYRAGWSHRPADAVQLFRKARYVQATIYHIRFGGEEDFGTLLRLRRSLAEGMNVDKPELAYQVVYGAASGTSIFLMPLASLTAFDEGSVPIALHTELRSGPHGKDVPFDAEISRERLLFRVEPQASYVSDDFAAADPNFWHGR